MAINTFDDFVGAISSGRAIFLPLGIQSATTATSNRFYFLGASAGLHSTSNFSYPGTALTWQQLDHTSSLHVLGAAPDPGEIFQLLYGAVWANSSSVAPSTIYFCHVAGYYPGINLNTTSPQNLTGTPTNIGTGEGYYATLVCTAAQGSSGPTITLTYTNSANASRTSTSRTNSSNPVHGCIQRSIALNRTAGDLGVQSVQSISFSPATTGTAALFLFRPICAIPIFSYNVAAERDFLNQVPSLPIIEPNQCISIFAYFGSSYNGTLLGHLIALPTTP